MGLFRRIADALFMTAAVEQGPRFAVDQDAIPPGFFGLGSYDDEQTPIVPRVSRRAAMQVPAVKRGRDLICAPIGGLPLQTYNSNQAEVTDDLLKQPEADVPRIVTMTRTVEDMLFEQRAWWRVVEWTGPRPYNYPRRIRRLDPRSVQIRANQQVYVSRDGSMQGASWEWVPDEELIRFDSPTDGILTAGAGAIATILMLDRRAYRSAKNPVPDGYFTPYDGTDPFDEDDESLSVEERAALYTAQKFLAEWAAARQLGTQGYVPGGLKYEQLQWDPKAMQLAEARQHAVLEIARLMGLEPEDLGVSTTSRTYFNAETKRRDRIDFTLGMYMTAIQDRLSMGDVTPRGQYVRFNVDAFLRTDTLARYQAYAAAKDLGLLTLPEMRELEDLPPLPDATGATPPEDQTVNNVHQLPAASSRPAANFAADAPLIMSAPIDQAFKVDLTSRTVTGLVVPYGGAQAYSMGSRYQFAKGTIAVPADVSRVKMFVNHDENRAIGYATKLEDTDAGLVGTFKVVNTPAGDEALLMADQHVWDGLSGGFRQGGQFTEKDGVQFAVSAPLGEVSLCPSPAFDDARVSAVALSADTGGTMECEHCGHVHAAGVTTCDPQAVAAFAARRQGQTFNGQPAVTQLTHPQGQSAPAGQGQIAQPGPNFAQQVQEAITAGFAQLAQQLPALTYPQRQVIPAGGDGAGQAQFQVREELPYRFDGSTKGAHCFTDDLRDMQNGNQEAKQRLEKFMDESHAQFAVTTGNVGAFNPTQNRPELYVPNLQYTRPLFDLVSTGTIDSVTPFTVPKFASATGLVGPHTQGIEPTPGAFTATVQTIQPTAVSGKVEINREVWDQGGNPQSDTIIWGEMQNAYYEAVEVSIATMLNALSAATLYTGAEINLAGAVDAALNTALTNLLVDLQYVRGGNRYTQAAAAGELFKAIASAKDTAGRPLFPLLGPTNANGQVDSAGAPASSANVLGQKFVPAWALNATPATASNSYMFVKSSVWQWVSAPKRFTFEYQTKSIDMAVWGYTAGAVLRNSDVARIDYSTTD